jgi:nucleoside-diphosphate-sugar epimerase
MTILVTGATGFIGSHVTRALLDRGHTIRATRRSPGLADKLADVHDDVEWVDLDLTTASPEDFEALCSSVDACIHSAWYAEPGLYARSTENVGWVGTSLRLLEALADAGCGRAVFIGTCFEYDHRHGYLAESTPASPWNLYGAAKLATSYMGRELARDRDLSFAWVRLFYQYGPHEDGRRLVPYVIRTLLEGDDALVSRGDQVRDFLHVSDVASAVAAVTESDRTGVVNIGSGHPVRVRDVVGAIAKQLGAERRVRYGARAESPSDPPFICANVERLRSEVGWTPGFDLDEGIRDTIEWWQEKLKSNGEKG